MTGPAPQQVDGRPPAQDPTGTLLNQASTTPSPSPSPSPEPPAPEPPKEPGAEPPKEPAKEPEPSLLNKKDEPKGPPEKYENFSVPDGFEIPEQTLGEVHGLFKDLGLDQAGAQRLIDFYAAKSLEAADAPVKFYKEMQDSWIKEIQSDPKINLDTVKSTVGRALDGLGDQKLAADFRAAMDLTGAGNNPAFIRVFYKLAQKVTEGTHVQAGSPAPVSDPSRPRSAAQAMYPNLP